MNKFYKRLPCLLLALVIAVSSFAFSVPVVASEIYFDDCSFGYNVPGIGVVPFVYIDGVEAVSSGFPCFLSFSSSGWISFAVYSTDNFVVNHIDVDSGYLNYRITGPLTVYVFVRSVTSNYSDEWSVSVTEFVEGNASGRNFYGDFWISNFSDASLSNFDSFDFKPIEVLTPVGVLNVFTEIGSWLAGAVNNIAAMFWTADGGLSVLGVLAVASLAIAFIILLIYLLAGWMKFK